MRRCLCMLAFLLSFLLIPAAHAAPPSPEEVCHLIDSLHTMHQARHTLVSVGIDQVEYRTDGIYPDMEPDILLGCLEYYLPMKTDLPQSAGAVEALVRSAMESALAVMDSVDGVHPINLSIYEAQPNGLIGIVVPSQNWWRYGQNEVFDMFTTPVFLINESNEVIDDVVYAMTVYVTDEMTGMWLCADQDISRDLLVGLNPPEDDGTDATAFLLQWLAEQGWSGPQEAEQAEDIPEKADTRPEQKQDTPLIDAADAIGRVTVVGDKRVNIRRLDRTNSELVGYSHPGDQFSVLRVMPSGWYRILFEDEIAYIAPGLVLYEDY